MTKTIEFTVTDDVYDQIRQAGRLANQTTSEFVEQGILNQLQAVANIIHEDATIDLPEDFDAEAFREQYYNGEPEGLRGDPENPVNTMQVELGEVLQRYNEVLSANPGYVSALLVDYADSIRDIHGLEHDTESLGAGVHLLHFGDGTGFLGVPRSGKYADVDADALEDLLDADVTDEGISARRIELDDEAEEVPDAE